MTDLHYFTLDWNNLFVSSTLHDELLLFAPRPAETFMQLHAECALYDIDLDQHRGQWVLVNFFATWCPPCVQEQPHLVRLANDTGGRLQIVSIAAGDTAENVTKFFAEQGGDWPVLVSGTDAASIDYGLIKLPESYLISPEGTVVEKFAGGITAAQVERRIAAAAGADASSGTGS